MPCVLVSLICTLRSLVRVLTLFTVMIISALNYSSIKLREREEAEKKKAALKKKQKEERERAEAARFTTPSRDTGVQTGTNYEESLG